MIKSSAHTASRSPVPFCPMPLPVLPLTAALPALPAALYPQIPSLWPVCVPLYLCFLPGEASVQSPFTHAPFLRPTPEILVLIPHRLLVPDPPDGLSICSCQAARVNRAWLGSPGFQSEGWKLESHGRGLERGHPSFPGTFCFSSVTRSLSD